MKKIGKALRREAVEACLCSAQFHMDPFQPSGVGTFSQAAIGLAWKAITVVVDDVFHGPQHTLLLFVATCPVHAIEVP